MRFHNTRVTYTRNASNVVDQITTAGSSLIEVLVATLIISLVMTAVISTVVVVMRNYRSSDTYTRATNYVQGSLDWVHKYRDYWGWQTFKDEVGASIVLCRSVDLSFPIPDSGNFGGVETASNHDNCTEGGTPLMKRSVKLTSWMNKISAEARVTWDDNGKAMESNATLILTEW